MFTSGYSLTKEEKARIAASPTIGYWSTQGGVEVKFIEDRDYDTCVFGLVGTFAGTPKPFKRNIQYTTQHNSREYIEINRERLYMDECIRNEVPNAVI